MKVSIHQPDFIPWLGFFLRWKAADVFIILDDVQFLRKGWHNRDKVITPTGPQWLTVPVKKKGRRKQLISEVEIDNSIPWRRKHLGTLKTNYQKAPFFTQYWGSLKEIYDREHTRLISLNIDLLLFGAQVLGVDTPLKYSSECAFQTTSTQRLIDLVKACQGNEYLTGSGSKDYLEEHLFEKESINVIWYTPSIPQYKQLIIPFVPGLSFLDYLFMVGKPL